MAAKNYQSPIGVLGLIEEDGYLTDILLSGLPATIAPADSPLLDEVSQQLDDYFAGRLQQFTIPIRQPGTPFQQAVWDELQRIGYGETISYGELARRIGRPKAVRAVGGANNRNRLPIIIPCHRVIGQTGKLVGYAGGLDMKTKLLELEKNHANHS